MKLQHKRLLAVSFLVIATLCAIGGILIDLAINHLVGMPLLLLGCLIFWGTVVWDIIETTKLGRKN